MSELIEAYRPKAVEFEGEIPWMYLDTVGKVTVAIGHMMPTADAAVTLPFTKSDGGAPATEAEIRDAHAAVAAARKGLIAQSYRPLTDIVLDAQARKDLHESDTEAFLVQLRGRFTDYDSYPLDAQLGILDMAYNLGVQGLWTKFPTWRGACLARDWRTCAEECRRTGIQQARNDWTRERFLGAAAGS